MKNILRMQQEVNNCPCELWAYFCIQHKGRKPLLHLWYIFPAVLFLVPTSLPLVPARGGAGDGGERGERSHVALPALGRPEARARLVALVAVLPEQAAPATRVAEHFDFHLK